MKRVAFVLAGIVSAAAGQMRVEPMTNSVGREDAPNLSPDGKTLAFIGTGDDYADPKLYTMPVGGREPVLLTPDSPFLKEGCGARSPSWSPDGRRLAYIVTCMNGEPAVYIRDFATGKDREAGECVETELLISWSADGGSLAFNAPVPEGGRGRAVVVSAEAGTKARQLVPDGVNPSFSPDGKWLAYSQEGVLKIAELTRDLYVMGPALTLARVDRPITTILWAPNSKRLLFQVGEAPTGCYRSVAAERNAVMSDWIDLPSRLMINQILPDGSALGSELLGGIIMRLDLRVPKPKDVPIRWSYKMIRTSPDGSRVAFVDSRCGVNKILIADAGLQHARVVADAPGEASELDWTPDGKSIAFQTGPENTRFVVGAAGGKPRQVAAEPNLTPWEKRHVSPDGKFSRYFNRDGYFCQEPMDGGVGACFGRESVASVGRRFLHSLAGDDLGTVISRFDPITRKAVEIARVNWSVAYVTAAGPDDRFLYLEEGETEFGIRIVRIKGF